MTDKTTDEMRETTDAREIFREHVPAIMAAQAQVNKMIYALDDAMPGGVTYKEQKRISEWSASALRWTLTESEVEGCIDDLLHIRAVDTEKFRAAVLRQLQAERKGGANFACGGGGFNCL